MPRHANDTLPWAVQKWLTDLDVVWVVDSDAAAHGCHLANTTEPPVCCGDAAFLSNYFNLLSIKLEMWANAQCDGLPAEYRRRLLFNAAMFGWRPVLECRAVTRPRRETRWNLPGCSKLANRSQQLVGQSSPYYEDMWRRYCCLTSFFPIVDTCLSCEDIAWQTCGMVPRYRLFGDFLHAVFSVSRVQHVSDLHSKFTERPHHVWKYGRHPISDRWHWARKKDRKKKKPQDEYIYGLPYYVGWP